MKFWRPGITGKLFLAIFATCIVLLISMHWAVRISFERGFIDYIKRGNEQRLTMLSDALSEQYAQHGSWAFLRNNDRFIFQLLRTFERDNDDRSPPGHAMKPDALAEGDQHLLFQRHRRAGADVRNGGLVNHSHLQEPLTGK